jgi:hypothetical protein
MKDRATGKGIELGTWLGRRQAFALVAGRCSAADAECVRRLREERQYRALGVSWEQFCKQHLGISRRWADVVIAQLKEFGPQYFVLAQATGIRPDEYRRIRGAVRGNALLLAGEEIPIDADNAPRLAAAVEELRRGPGAGQERDSGPMEGHADADGAGNLSTASAAQAQAKAEIEREFERAARGVKLARVHFQRLVEMRLEGHDRIELMAQLGQAAGQFRDLEQASWK